MKRSVVLAILDGWGIGAEDVSNPIFVAKPPTVNYFSENFPSGALQASGIAVGLPWGEEGNSEVGHLTLGAGKVIYQHFPRITLAVRSGEFFNNPAFLKAANHVQKTGGALNLIGLLTAGNVHSSFDHLVALLEFAKRNRIFKVNLHLFADGKDSPPKSVLNLLSKLNEETTKAGAGQVASLSGRYYALDRDGHWDRTEATYRVLVGDALLSDASAAVSAAYGKNLSDEFIEPTLVGSQNLGIKSGDAVVFFNFREDSMRQVAQAFIKSDFDKFPTKKLESLLIVTMTRYKDDFNVEIAFPQETVSEPLSKVLSEAGKSQLKIAETEKYAHVTYFFNGYRDALFAGEYRVFVPSKNVASHDQAPEMMAEEITNRAIAALEEKAFDFILINYANPDIVAHTGNYDAVLKAVTVVDRELERLSETVLAKDDFLIVSADHGNAERVMNPLTGQPETKHDPNPVPVYLIANELKKLRSPEIKKTIGILSDVAPTVLDILNIPKPKEMTGQSLLKLL